MKLLYIYRQRRSRLRRLKRLLFASPAECRFIEIMGGRVWRLWWLTNRRGFPLIWHYKLGQFLAREYIAREVKAGQYFVDFGCVTPYYKKAIEVDGAQYHDILADGKRDRELRLCGWQILHIPAMMVFYHPKLVRKKVEQFLAR